MFKFNVDGIERTLMELDQIFSPSNMKKIKDIALEEGASFLRDKIAEAQKGNADTGATYKSVIFSEPKWIDGKRTITIHWKDDEPTVTIIRKGKRVKTQRWRIIHLLENGFHDRSGSFVKPVGSYGQIESVLASNRAQYIQIVQDSIARQIGA